jgi:hypothetical protein
MRKRPMWIATGVLSLMLAGVGPALATQGGNGGGGASNGSPSNAHGLCTAANNGNKNGWDKNGVPPAFQNFHDNYLEGVSNETQADTEGTRQDIIDDCNSAGIPVGGQPGKH